ncbi:MAG: thioredoxin domain-containing protein [Bacteroidales bacterium]|nr:thioredoxin domain-containing protein [Bacteroidales bacterium]
MKRMNLKSILLVLTVIFTLSETGCTQTVEKEENKQKEVTKAEEMGNKQKEVTKAEKNENYKVTFIELGSVRCIPCQKMQPIMKSVEEKYAGQVKVVFYDVWTPEGSPYGDKYNINVIPTQVFLDAEGKEYFRHEGFFAEEELVKVLKQKGVE